MISEPTLAVDVRETEAEVFVNDGEWGSVAEKAVTVGINVLGFFFRRERRESDFVTGRGLPEFVIVIG